MVVDINAADAASAFAVLLHPHPDYGGDRFHPFVDALFVRLPTVSVSAIRFDFSTVQTTGACDEVLDAIDLGTERWPHLPVIVVGYSFGAGIAAMIDDQRIAGWYLLAPPAVMLAQAAIGDDPRPKAVLVPEHDQFAPPKTVERLAGGWRSLTISELAGTDHFLGPIEPAVRHALGWIGSLLDPSPTSELDL